jgi:diguanylate cyclase (GGDEF)-like protein
MALDIPTLFLVSTCITCLLGVFLLVLWLQDRSVRALGYWAAAYLIGGFAVGMWIVGPGVLPTSVDLSSALLFICCGMIWSGARKFHGRPTLPSIALAGAFIWLIATHMPEVIERTNARVILSSLIITFYAVMTATELRWDRRRAKGPRVARVFLVPILHGAIFLSPIVTTTLIPGASHGANWFPLFALLTLLYVVGTAFIVVVMAKDHSALVHKTEAMTDHLTGLFNRRGFLEAAEKLVDNQRKLGQPVSIMMFDLDYFKAINDRFGHDAGDDALVAFAATASSSMRLYDIVGRLGGEEFAAILPGGSDTAALVGERVRSAFELRGHEIAGHVMNATVSIGIAEAPGDLVRISDLLSRADRALYAAKASGRNRIFVDHAVAPPIPDAEQAESPVPAIAALTGLDDRLTAETAAA